LILRLVKGRIKEKSLQNKQQVFTVSRFKGIVPVSFLGKPDTSRKQSKNQSGGFYPVNVADEINETNAIGGVIHESQTLVNGSIVKLRLLDDIYVNGSRIPKDNFIHGIASLDGERLKIEINSIRFKQSLFPVNLVVYDVDGLAGVYIPGAITRDVAKQSADNSLQLMELSTMDPSLKAQATAAGISAAKNLFSRKVKLVKVMVKAGYNVLLKDGNQKE
jgi:conjugative transposon TraM protein